MWFKESLGEKGQILIPELGPIDAPEAFQRLVRAEQGLVYGGTLGSGATSKQRHEENARG